MRRAGFTMIELIFVIVILGILSAVAVPKMMGVSEKANAGVCKSFYSSLNKTVGPALWSNMAIDNDAVDVAFTTDTLATQIEVPANDKCGSAAQIVAGAVSGTDYTITIDSTNYDINATAASSSAAPIWKFGKQ